MSFVFRTPEERRELHESLSREIKAQQQRTQMMVDKLYDQMSRGCIDNEWAETFIESIRSQVSAGLPLSSRQQTKLEELFERY